MKLSFDDWLAKTFGSGWLERNAVQQERNYERGKHPPYFDRFDMEMAWKAALAQQAQRRCDQCGKPLAGYGPPWKGYDRGDGEHCACPAPQPECTLEEERAQLTGQYRDVFPQPEPEDALNLTVAEAIASGVLPDTEGYNGG